METSYARKSGNLMSTIMEVGLIGHPISSKNPVPGGVWVKSPFAPR